MNILDSIASVPRHWFRIAYARNAFLRSLGGPVDGLGVAAGTRAMVQFVHDFRPQHAELDTLECSWGASADGFEFAIGRRMLRHDHPEVTLSLCWRFAPSPARVVSGRATVATLREVTATEGYRAVARAGPLGVELL